MHHNAILSKLIIEIPKDEISLDFSSIIFSSIIILLSKNEEAVVYGVIVENNPFYGYSLVNMSDYQSAQALSVRASKIFNDKLKFTEIDSKNITGYIINLENGLTQLNNLVEKKDSPPDLMMIVHTQIHPNLLEAFNLQLRN